MLIATKPCSRCGSVKPLTEFHKRSKGSSDGRACWCKVCRNEYNKRLWTENDRNSSRLLREKRSRIEQPDRWSARYRRKGQLEASKARARRRQREHPSPPHVRQAHQAVHRAIASGVLVPPERCSKCGRVPSSERRRAIEGHHHNGYAREHWLDVVWLCTRCHVRTEMQAS